MLYLIKGDIKGIFPLAWRQVIHLRYLLITSLALSGISAGALTLAETGKFLPPLQKWE